MAEYSGIEWCDHTVNIWIGCEKVSAGCKHCYAEDWNGRFNMAEWGKHGKRTETKRWRQQLKRLNRLEWVSCDVGCHWRGKLSKAVDGLCPECCEPVSPARQRVFINSLSDFFEDRPELEAVRREAFDVFTECSSLDIILLTKRPGNIGKMCEYALYDEHGGYHGWGLNNIWLLASVENQEMADKRIPELLKWRDYFPVLGLSVEPMLGPVNFGRPAAWADCPVRRGISWVIVGGESGSKAGPMNPEWVRDLRDQCVEAGVAFNLKQWGEWLPFQYDAGSGCYISGSGEGVDYQSFHTMIKRNGPFSMESGVVNTKGIFRCTRDSLGDPDAVFYQYVGKKKAGRLLGGRLWDEFPGVG